MLRKMKERAEVEHSVSRSLLVLLVAEYDPSLGIS